MADLIVEVVKIGEVNHHENADRLDIVKVFGYNVVAGRDEYQPGDCAVYFPVDSILPQALQDHIFAGSKMKLSKDRIRAARIRGCVSQGLLVSIPKVKKYIARDCADKMKFKFLPVGEDLTEALAVTKHNPEKNKPAQLVGNQKKKAYCHPLFRKYTKIQHWHRNDQAFVEGQEVVATEKIHGTNFRCGWVPTVARSWIDKIRIKIWDSEIIGSKLIGLPAWTFVYGSHNVELKRGATGAAHGNVYERIVIEHHLAEKIELGSLWYGEIYGHGIQKGYDYGFKPGEVDVRFFDVMDSRTGKYMDFFDMVNRVVLAGEKVVPYEMLYFNRDRIDKALNHPPMKSNLDETLDIEGMVLRSYNETTWLGGRAILKWISDAYLLKKQSEFK